MIINHNMNAMNAHRQMGINTINSGKAMEKLSSGLRINRAGDDAAGLAISEKMRGQIRGLDQASRNSQDGISMIQTAEGALNETHSILQRMKELAVQASNDTNTTEDRAQLQQEVNQLTSEINRVGNTTEFNTQKLLNGNKAGDAAKAGDIIKAKAEDVKAGEVNFTVKGLEDGKKLNISGTDVSIATADFANAGALKTKLEGGIADTDITVTGDNTAGFKVTIKEKATKEGTKITAATVTSEAGTLSEVSGHKGVKVGDTLETVSADREGRVKLQVGANEHQSMSIEIGDMRSKALGISGDADAAAADGAKFTKTTAVTDGTSDATTEAGLDLSSHANATAAVKVLDSAINTVSTQRSKLGAYQNRLEHTINNLNTSSENLQASESRIRDVDMAKEMMNFSKNNILAQAAQAMLAQANQQPQGVLQLLR
ncbi:flagellin [Hathewaya histolytica]|nr:flagellin [Hathewaya histolytica]